ncbi:hypothetical protein NDA11_007071 [Ustilago hordei]|nr:hypothetical protein NDA11_007071 [Ustilago hordei]
MPPSTRAGQTGRGDDDQTTGNGQEEGWLTQVVRILQLANPALLAEEAIVRAMGLVNISNQAPCGETEKIPKDISSSIAHIKKLSDSNWHTWEPTFIDCLQRVHNAKEILYGTVVPGSEEYDEDLDKALVGLIHACCNNSPDSRIDTYTVRGVDEEVQLGSTLYAKLKKALTLNDAVKRAGLQDRIHTVRLHNRDVVRLGKELDSIWNDAARLGKRFDKDLKKSTLYRCTAQDWFYANTVDALKTARPDCKYDEAYHALAKKQQDGEITGRIRGAARVATSAEQGSANQININVMMTPRSGVGVDDDEVDGVGDEIGDVDDNEVDGVDDKVGGVDDNEVDGVGDKVGGVNTSVQCVDLMLEVIPGPQWTTAFGSIYIRTANLLWAPSDVR